MHLRHRSLTLLIVMALLAACTAPPVSTSTPEPAATATAVPTATAAATNTAVPPEPTATQAPTATALPAPDPTVPPVAVGSIAQLPAGTDGFPWWNDSVFYEIFVRSFYDSNGDGVGDLRGIIEKLDYLNDGDPTTTTDLGVTGLWLMPIFASPSYHGYDVVDYRTINPDYGTADDFKELMAAAHKRGIRVVIDFVLNHTSNQHPWFVEAQDPDSPYQDWYIWKAESPGFTGPWGETVWHYAGAGAGGYYYGVFTSGMPDLNYANPAVEAEMLDVAKFWMQDMGVDGFRLDGARYLVEDGRNLADTKLNHELYARFREMYKAVNPEAMSVGEVWTKTSDVAPYVQGDQLDLAFNFDLATAFIKAVKTHNSDAANTQLLLGNQLFKPGQFATFLSNHDQDRVLSQLLGEMGGAKAAAGMMLTAPGVPFVYYGEELGMRGAKPDEKIRTPMMWSAEANAGFTTGTPWEDPNTEYEKKNVEVYSADPASIWSLYRDLIRLRAEHAALRIGDAAVVKSNDPGVFAMLRSTADEKILIVVNLKAEAMDVYALDLGKGPLSGAYAIAPLFGEGDFYAPSPNAAGGFDSYQPVAHLDPYGVYVIQLQPQP